jgi:hypothetical protein
MFFCGCCSGRTTTLGLPSARLVSETIAARPTVYDTARHSVLYTAFGILVTHDLTRTAPGTEKLQQRCVWGTQCFFFFSSSSFFFYWELEWFFWPSRFWNALWLTVERPLFLC